jgi:hypothetical protein
VIKGRKDHQQERKENITRARSSAQERKEKNVHGYVSVIEHHLLTLTVFMLIMAIVSIDDNLNLHLLGAYGMFGTISLYCFLHTAMIVYLFIRRSDAPQHSNILWVIWFVVCSLLLITFFVTWIITHNGIPEYIAAATPFLYFLGFIPQFWMRARAKKRDSLTSRVLKFSSEVDI